MVPSPPRLFKNLMPIMATTMLSIHYNDVKMSVMASQITSLTIVYSTVYSRRGSKKTSKLRVTGLCAGNSPVTGEIPRKGPVTRKMFPFDGAIMSHIKYASTQRPETNNAPRKGPRISCRHTKWMEAWHWGTKMNSNSDLIICLQTGFCRSCLQNKWG